VPPYSLHHLVTEQHTQLNETCLHPPACFVNMWGLSVRDSQRAHPKSQRNGHIPLLQRRRVPIPQPPPPPLLRRGAPPCPVRRTPGLRRGAWLCSTQTTRRRHRLRWPWGRTESARNRGGSLVTASCKGVQDALPRSPKRLHPSCKWCFCWLFWAMCHFAELGVEQTAFDEMLHWILCKRC
jgi:hypothetical protein